MNTNQADRFGLDRPLIVFDLETTGLSVSEDRIIQLAYGLHVPGAVEPTYETFLFNPGRPIPPQASEVHGWTDADVADKPLFKDKAAELHELFKDASYSGFNIAGFDLPLLAREFLRCGFHLEYSGERIFDSKIIYHYMEPRTLASAYRHYCAKELVGAHDALVDVRAADEIIAAQFDRYGAEHIRRIHAESYVEPVDIEGKFYWKDGQICFAFSKFKHQPLSEVAKTERGFLEWILTADFSDEVKTIVRRALAGDISTGT